MKVRCLKLQTPTGIPTSASHWLIVGHEYPVLMLSTDSTGRTHLRIPGENGPGPSLFPLDQFEIVDSSLPKNWIISVSPKGGFSLAPAKWQQSGFWERYFDRDAAAIATFEAERNYIIAG